MQKLLQRLFIWCKIYIAIRLFSLNKSLLPICLFMQLTVHLLYIQVISNRFSIYLFLPSCSLAISQAGLSVSAASRIRSIICWPFSRFAFFNSSYSLLNAGSRRYKTKMSTTLFISQQYKEITFLIASSSGTVYFIRP